MTTFLSFVKVKVKVKNLEALKLFMVDKLLTKRTLATSKSHYRNNGNGEVYPYCLKYTKYSRQQTIIFGKQIRLVLADSDFLLKMAFACSELKFLSELVQILHSQDRLSTKCQPWQCHKLRGQHHIFIFTM